MWVINQHKCTTIAKNQLQDYSKTQCDDHFYRHCLFNQLIPIKLEIDLWVDFILVSYHSSFVMHLILYPVNLHRYSIQCEAKCSVCNLQPPTTAHIKAADWINNAKPIVLLILTTIHLLTFHLIKVFVIIPNSPQQKMCSNTASTSSVFIQYWNSFFKNLPI